MTRISAGMVRLLAISVMLAAAGIIPASAAADPYPDSQTFTFPYPAGGQKFMVPDGIAQVTIDAIGGAGAGSGSDGQGALGGEAIGTVPVTPGQTLEVVVGGQANGGSGGYNGGGNSSAQNGGGGGESDVRVGSCASSNNCPASDAIVVAGGAGGTSGDGTSGGVGGGNGANGNPANYGSYSGNGQGGFGGTQSGYGAGGHGGGEGQGDYYASGANGSANHGGSGGGGGCSGAGGGAGYWGGGGGGASEPSVGCGSGGGGASYVEPGSPATYNGGVSSGDTYDANGLVTISWCCSSDTYGTPEDLNGDDLATSSGAGSISSGTPVIDNAEVYPDNYNDPRYPTGTVSFSVCGPLSSASGCVAGQDSSFGSPVQLADEGDPTQLDQYGNANSSQFTPNYGGTYCFLASYSGDGTFASSSDGTADDQCFTVTGPTKPTSTTKSAPASATVPYGSLTDDVATVTGSSPTGSVSFSVCGPLSSATGCASGGTSLGSANLSSGSATSPSFTATQLGTYCFRATYAGDSKNVGSTDSSSDGCFTLTKAVVHVDANSASKNLGDGDPSPSGTLRATDFHNGDTAGVVSGSPSCQIASHSQNAGTYYGAITCSAGSLSATNYSFTQGNAANFTISQGSATTSMTVDDTATGTGWSNTEVAGASAYDTATVSGVNGFTPTGSVTYSLFNNSSCATPADGTPQTVTLNNDGSVPDSSSSGALSVGSYSYQATYSGDGNYPGQTIACTSFTVVPAADLSATETDTVSGQTTLGNSWTWNIALANGGGADATFSDGQTILTDDLPSSNIGYGTPGVSDVTDITNSGNISCQVSSNELSCAASGGPVTIGASDGSFTVGVLATPTMADTYANPADGGVCAADPNSVITESPGANTSCSDSVLVQPVADVSNVSPASGTLAGGTPITITGTGFVSGATVEVGQGKGAGPTAISATDVNVVSSTEITATTAGATKAGRFNLFVVEGGVTSQANPGDYYTYADAGVSNVSPASGTLAGGTPITITGTGFVSGAEVEIGQGQRLGPTAIPATDVDVVSSTEITATTPSATKAGRYNLFVVEGGETSRANPGDYYSYTAPTVSQVDPASGTLAGGTPITITGTGFVSGAVVKIAQGQGAGPTAIAATDVNVFSSTEITATTASATKAGTFNLFVLEDGATSAANSGDYYTYTPATAAISLRHGRLIRRGYRLRAPRERPPRR